MSSRLVYGIVLATIIGLVYFFVPIYIEIRIEYRAIKSSEGYYVYSDRFERRVTLYSLTVDTINMFLFNNSGTRDKELKDLENALTRIQFKRQWIEKLRCEQKAAIVMKYLKDKGFDVEMGRGYLVWGKEKIPHGWIVVKIDKKEYVVETSGETGTPYVVGTVDEASKGGIKYIEKERWSMKKTEERFKELLSKDLTEYLKIEQEK